MVYRSPEELEIKIEEAVKLYYEDMLPISTISSLLSIDSKRIGLWIKNYGEYQRR